MLSRIRGVYLKRSAFAMMGCLVVMMVAGVNSAVAGDEEINADKWIFDNKPITATSPGGPSVKSFKWSDFIYARVFFDKPIKDIFELTPERYGVKVYEHVLESGSAYDNVEMWIAKKDFSKNYLDIEIFPDPAKARTKFGEHGGTFHGPFWQDQFNLTGKQKVRYAVMKLNGDDQRAAIIEIDFTGIDKKKVRQLQKDVAAAGNAAFSANFGLPEPGKLHSAALAKALETMTTKGNRDLKACKVIITGDEWNIERHDISGKVLARTAEAAAVTKDKSGTCMLDSGSMFRQHFIGGKFKAPGEWMTMASTPNQIDCGKVFGGGGKGGKKRK